MITIVMIGVHANILKRRKAASLISISGVLVRTNRLLEYVRASQIAHHDIRTPQTACLLCKLPVPKARPGIAYNIKFEDLGAKGLLADQPCFLTSRYPYSVGNGMLLYKGAIASLHRLYAGLSNLIIPLGSLKIF